MDIVTFGLILDDIVFPAGGEARGVLGGGGPQTAFGARVWNLRAGLAAGVGADLPAAARAWLEQAGIDLDGLRVTPHPTPRARQTLQADGVRTQTWLTPVETLGAQLGRKVEYLPAAYRAARAFHFGTHPEEPDLGLARDLRALGGLVSMELFRPALRPLAQAELRALAGAADIFSLNLEEARSLLGPHSPEDLARQLLQLGAPRVTLRLGPAGALAADASGLWPIPAVTVNAVDPVGAGNAFCGGFLAGWLRTGDLRQAGYWAAVSASFLVEQVGLPAADGWQMQAARRLEMLTAQPGKT